MASLIDKMRSGVEKWETVQVHGFDPDSQTCGWAYLNAHYRTDVLGVFAIDGAYIGGLIATTKKKTGLDQAMAMVDGIFKGWPFWEKKGRVASFIESQQSYPDPDMDRGELIAKANDLLRLAHIAGAYHGLVHRLGHSASVLLPAQWKGQKPKPAMHRDVISSIKTHTTVPSPFFRVIVDGGLVENKLIPRMEDFTAVAGNSHSMDALCLAYAGLLRIVRGEFELKENL